MSIGGIDTSRIEAMVAQLKATAARATPNAAPLDDALPKTREGAAPGEFTRILKTSLDGVNRTQQHATQLAQRFEMGDSNVSLADAMIALQKSSIAMQATIQVRNRMVSAYQEIMSMSI
ncbi:MAG: flagellar hook-basal body complex protein FliE [Thiobacillus sp.]